MTDFEQQYEAKCHEFDELNEQFIAYQGRELVDVDESALMIEELETFN